MGLLTATKAQIFAAGPPQPAQAPAGAGNRQHPGWPPASSAGPQPNGRRAPFQRHGPHPGRNHPGGVQLRSARLRPSAMEAHYLFSRIPRCSPSWIQRMAGGNGTPIFGLPGSQGRVLVHYSNSQGPRLSAYSLGLKIEAENGR